MNKEVCVCYVDNLKKENEALRLLLEWMIECDFGFDNIKDDGIVDWDEFEKETENMDYMESLIYYAKKYLENK